MQKMLKLLTLLILINAPASHASNMLGELLQCLEKARIQKNIKPIDEVIDVTNASRFDVTKELVIKNGKLIPAWIDGATDAAFYWGDMVLKSLGNIIFGGRKLSSMIADVYSNGMNKKVFRFYKVVTNTDGTKVVVEDSRRILGSRSAKFLVESLSSVQAKIGRTKSSEAILDYFKMIDGELRYTPHTGDDIKDAFQALKNLNANSAAHARFIAKLDERTFLEYNSYKSIYQSLQKYKKFPKNEEEAERFIDFVLHIDSYPQPTKDFLLKESGNFFDYKGISSAIRTGDQALFDKAYWKFKKLETKKLPYYEKRLARHSQSNSKEVAKQLAKKDTDDFVNLRYTCGARGSSTLRKSAAVGYKKFAMYLSFGTSTAIYGAMGGFAQEKGFQIYAHNRFIEILEKFIVPKIIVDKKFSNFAKVVQTFFVKMSSTWLDSATYAKFIETTADDNLDLEKFFKNVDFQKEIDRTIHLLEQSPEIREHIANINKIPPEQLSTETIRNYMQDKNLTTENIIEDDSEEEFLLNHLAEAIIQLKYQEKTEGRPFAFGTEAKDRAAWNSIYRSFAIFKSVGVGLLMYRTLCRGFTVGGKNYGGMANELEAKQLATALYLANIAASSALYRWGLHATTGQY